MGDDGANEAGEGEDDARGDGNEEGGGDDPIMDMTSPPERREMGGGDDASRFVGLLGGGDAVICLLTCRRLGFVVRVLERVCALSLVRFDARKRRAERRVDNRVEGVCVAADASLRSVLSSSAVSCVVGVSPLALRAFLLPALRERDLGFFRPPE